MNVRLLALLGTAVSVSLLVGCQSEKKPAAKPQATTAPVAKPAAPVAAPAPVAAVKPIRIKAGAPAPVTDKAGNVWQADKGFADGDTVERPDVKATGTDLPELFTSEHFGMTAFSIPVPNGKYTVKLYMAETYDGITAAGDRVFSVNVEGQELKNIDLFKDTGGLNKALVKTFNVEVKDGKLDISWVATVQNAEVNAIEITPAQ